VSIDTADLWSGSVWTLQSAHLNPAASSSRSVSISNAILMLIE